MEITVLILSLATLAAGSTISRYEWYDDSQGNVNIGDSEILRNIEVTPQKGIVSTAATAQARAPVGAGTAYKTNDDDDDERHLSPLSLSPGHLQLLKEILSSSYSDDGLNLDIIGNPNLSSNGRDDDNDDDDNGRASKSSGSGGNVDSASSSAKAEAIIADILAGGSTTPDVDDSDSVLATVGGLASSGTQASGPASGSGVLSVLDLAYKQFEASAQAFALAQTRADDAELALSDARAALSVAGGQSVAKAAASARTDAINTIATARAEARASVLAARQNYVSVLAKAHAKISAMKVAEKRFRAMAIAFSKARTYAGSSILALKKCSQDLKVAKTEARPGFLEAKSAYTTAVASAKARVSKMKVIEERFLAMAKAFAKVRSEAKTAARIVRKTGCLVACAFSNAGVKVDAAVASAKASIAQLIATAKATATARAQAFVTAAVDARSQARSFLQASSVAVAKARAQVEAVLANQATAPGSTSAKASASVSTSGDDDDDYDDGVALTSYSAPLSVAPAQDVASAAAKASASASAGTDAADSKTYY